MKKIIPFCILCAISLATAACKTEQQPRSTTAPRQAAGAVPAATAGPYRLELFPTAATRKTVIQVGADGFSPAAARIEWFVNGAPERATQPLEFACTDLPKGSAVQAKAVVAGIEVWSNTVEVRNTPPELTHVKLLPEIFRPGDALMMEARAEDLDGDETAIRYHWELNGRPAGDTSRLDLQPRRGDKIVVRITPFDGEDQGTALVLDREIGNLPPVFKEHQEFSFKDNRYVYQARASDPDGDALTYVLQAPSEHVTLDPSTGELVWTVPDGFTGDKSLTIIADDGHNGRAQHQVTFTIRE